MILVLVAWQQYADTQDYKDQRLRHLAKSHPVRADIAWQPPVPSQSNEPHVQEVASGSAQRSTFNASRDAPQSIEHFRQYEADYQLYEVPAAGPASTAASPPPATTPLWGRGSNFYQELANVRALRKSVLKGTADPQSVHWFHSKGFDRRLEELTRRNGTGRFWNAAGQQIDLRPHAFEDFIGHPTPP